MRTLEEQAIGTQNYFFLRLAAGRDVDAIMIDELDPFLEILETEIATLKPNIKHCMKTELDEGDYFHNKPIETITRMLNGASARITGSTMQNITDFYLSLHKEIQNDAGFNENPTTELLSPADIIAGAKDGTFKHDDKFKTNNGFTDYDARLTIETDGTANLTEIDLGFPLKPENQKKVWSKVIGESE